MPSSVQSSSSASPPPRAPAPRERKSTNKYTQKNNRYRDHLKTLEGYKLAVTKARAANNTYICRAKAAFINTKKAELDRLSEEERHEAYDEIARRSRQHSVLSMYIKSYSKSCTGLTHTGFTLTFIGCRKRVGLHQRAPGHQSSRCYGGKVYLEESTTRSN